MFTTPADFPTYRDAPVEVALVQHGDGDVTTYFTHDGAVKATSPVPLHYFAPSLQAALDDARVMATVTGSRYATDVREHGDSAPVACRWVRPQRETAHRSSE